MTTRCFWCQYFFSPVICQQLILVIHINSGCPVILYIQARMQSLTINGACVVHLATARVKQRLLNVNSWFFLEKKNNLRILRRTFKAANLFAEGKKLPTLKPKWTGKLQNKDITIAMNIRDLPSTQTDFYLTPLLHLLVLLNCCY